MKTEEEVVQRQTMKFEEMVHLEEFSRILRLDAKDPTTYQLFKIHDRANHGCVDLKEYIFTVLAIANANSLLDLVTIAFQVCDSNGTKCLNIDQARKALRLSLHLEPEDCDRIFVQATRENGGGDLVNLGKNIIIYFK